MRKSRVFDKIHHLVQRFLVESRLDPAMRVLVAVSGGPDSLTLLYSLKHLQPVLNLRLYGIHVNHGIRGRQSDEDARFVQDIFDSLDIPFTIGNADVPYVRAKYHLSLEEAARKVRYNLLYKTAQDNEAGYIALGHTADDQAETILMNIIRGAGLTGLRGMLPVRTWQPGKDKSAVTLLRPLLTATREETEAYCQNIGIQPRLDESNLSSEFTRNRLRNILMPVLRTFNPNIRTSLLNMSRSVNDDLEYIESTVEKAWENVVSVKKSRLTIDKLAFQPLPASIQHHMLRFAIAHMKGDLNEITLQHIEDMSRLTTQKTGKQMDIPGNLIYSVGYTKAVLSTKEQSKLQASSNSIEETQLAVPGKTKIHGWEITATVVKPPKTLPPANDLRACLNMESLGKGIRVRNRKNGDRFHPLGLPSEKKLQDFMTDAKIPRTNRDKIPLLISEHGIAWVVGYRIAEWAKVKEDSMETVLLEFRRT